jgi:carboxylesterase type B
VLRLQWPQQVADAIFQLYPSSAYQNSPLLAYIVAMGDIDFQCPKRNMLNIMSQAQLAPVWSALWTHVWDHGEPRQQPAGHATDIPFWLRTYAAADLTTNETILSNFMAGTLIKFAYTHDPRSAYIPWPAYQTADYAYFKWDTPSKAEMGTDLRQQQCTSLEQIGFNWEYFKTVH